MENQKKLDRILRTQNFDRQDKLKSVAESYAAAIAKVENVVAVVSDIAGGTSKIFAGRFGDILGLKDYDREESIWETEILSLMPPEDRDEKFISELRFFHYLRHLPRCRRRDYYLASRLRLSLYDGRRIDVLHRMYYLFDTDSETVRYAICLYGPLPYGGIGKSLAVNSVTGMTEELSLSTNSTILSRRERQILALIDSGLRSVEIADRLNISIHTVSRHRQEILSKLRVKNSHEACRLAKSMKIL